MITSATDPKTRVLLVEDSETDSLLIQAHLRKEGDIFEVDRVKTLAEAGQRVARRDVDVVLLDLNLPDSMGLETFERLHRRHLTLPIVVLSGHDDLQLALEAVSLGAQDYLPKNEVSRSSLVRCIRYAIERARRQRVEQELTAAGEIQRRLFPQKSPEVPGYDIFGRCEPANIAGGDYFDFFPIRGGRWGIVVADVSGHGIGPALIMSETRAILRTLATTCENVGEMLTRANEVLSPDLHNNIFVGLMLIALDPRTGQIRHASAGHTAVVLDSAGDLKVRLASFDPPLGIIEGRHYATSGNLTLDRGDTLLIYTDGMVECFSGQEEQFGEARLLEAAAEAIGEPGWKIINNLFDRVADFSGGSPQQDDMTAVVVRALPGDRSEA